MSNSNFNPAGEIVNLINVDCQKLIDACLVLNLLWSAPLQVGLSIYFLYQTIGVAVFVGMKNYQVIDFSTISLQNWYFSRSRSACHSLPNQCPHLELYGEISKFSNEEKRQQGEAYL